jgi:hypothetical protein
VSTWCRAPPGRVAAAISERPDLILTADISSGTVHSGAGLFFCAVHEFEVGTFLPIRQQSASIRVTGHF